jgi:hypothetical protein
MRRIIAIAAISIQNAIRSRMVISLVLLLAVAVVGLPLSLKGDGTAEGQLRIVVTYTLGASFMLIAMSSLWAGALAISQEIEYQQIQLLATKPVRSSEIWLGKWIGLMAVHAALLLAAAIATAVLLPRDLLDAQSREGRDWRSVFQPIAPEMPNFAAKARDLLEERIRIGDIAPDAPRETALRALEKELALRAGTVAPGRRVDWKFSLPRMIQSNEIVRVRFRAASSVLGMTAVRGRWIAGNADRDSNWQRSISLIPNTYQEIDIPGSVIADNRVLYLSFVNDEPSHVTLVFDPKDGMRVLLPSGEFYTNYARAVLMLLFRLGFISALGVTVGALFSSPVALFMGVALLAAAQLAGYTAEFYTTPSGVLLILDRLGDVFRFALRPLSTPPALDAVATGLRVETAWLIRVFGVQTLAYGGSLAALGARTLARRELALPQI